MNTSKILQAVKLHIERLREVASDHESERILRNADELVLMMLEQEPSEDQLVQLERQVSILKNALMELRLDGVSTERPDDPDEIMWEEAHHLNKVIDRALQEAGI